ncbi:MAG: LysM domain-containing protein [Myxococcales bacterium]
MLPKTRLARVRHDVLRAARRECSARGLKRRLTWMALSSAVSAAVGFGHVAADDLVTSQMPGADTHSVVSGDTLWDLSNRYYRSSWEWPRLWSYNPEITNPHWIYPGHVLRLREGAQGGFSTGEQAVAGTPAGVLRPKGFLGNRSRLPQGTVQLGDQVYLDRDALDGSGKIVGSSEDHMMLFPSDEVYLAFDKKNTPPQPGQELSVFVRYHKAEVTPKAGRLRTYHRDSGEVVRVLGVLKVKSYDEDRRMARAVIVEANDPIERGFEVTDTPRSLAQVAPKTNTHAVKSEIVAATRPLGTLGQNQVVFIGAGSKQGVEVGNRFAVVRQGDAWRDNLTLREDLTGSERPSVNPPKGKEYPVEVVAEARVIYVRPESCTALITEALQELTPGDKVEMREGY